MSSRSLTRASRAAGLAVVIACACPPVLAADESEEVISANELLQMCERLHADDASERLAALEEITSLGKENAAVVEQRLQADDAAPPENMRLVLTSLRKDIKDRTIADLQARGKKVDLKNVPTPDPPEFLTMLVEKPDRNYPEGWRDAIEVMTLLVSLANMGTTESIGFILDYSPEYEAAFRKEIYQIVKWLGPSSVPALIRRQDTKDEHIQRVVSTALETFKMERPGQQVQVEDHRILIEVLEAFGDERDPDALDTIAAFLDSPKDDVRETARRVILGYNKLALWTLKEEYKEYTGEMPDPDWEAHEIAGELFRLMDAERMAPFHDRMQEGLGYAESGEYEKMEKAYREILAEQPSYGRKAEMVPGYMAYGAALIDAGDLERATLMYKVSLRLDADGDHTKEARARLHLIDGLRSVDEGAPDLWSFEKALDMDPGLDVAKEHVAELERLDRKREIGRYRILGALGIGSAALILLGILVIWRLR